MKRSTHMTRQFIRLIRLKLITIKIDVDLQHATVVGVLLYTSLARRYNHCQSDSTGDIKKDPKERKKKTAK